jgi:hypothetical protein
MAKIISRVIGVLYLVLGGAGFALGDEADLYHNVLHLLTGVVGVYVGYVGSLAAARAFCLVFGAGYLAFGALGFVLGDPSLEYALDVGRSTVSTPDHVHHLILGTLLLAGGTLARSGFRRRSAGLDRHGVSPAGSGRRRRGRSDSD